MTSRAPRGRSGITLTEILISILIMGIGMVSLATLFPIGLLRIRDAQRNSRSVLEARTAFGDVEGRGLFYKPSFDGSWYGAANSTFGPYDPWQVDPLTAVTATNPTGGGVGRGYGPGLPVMYDPLWWSVVGRSPAPLPGTLAGRFGAATANTLHADPGGSNAAASAAGLQRLTNYVALTDPSLFVSLDDPIMQTEGPQSSPLLPVLTNLTYDNDWAYSWAFTGQRTDVNDFTVYDGSMLIFNNRPLAIDNGVPAGERVVEGVFAYGRRTGSGAGYSSGDPRLVLLRWLNTQPDPDVTVGSWLADVTYEQNGSSPKAMSDGGFYPMQRCYWYRVAKRSEAVPDPDATNYGAYRRMIVTLSSPVRARTLLQAGSDVPVYTNAALLCPSVVNAFPKVFYTR